MCLDACVINCVKLAHEKLIQHFGIKILSDDHTVNRKKLGSIVFTDKQKLNEFNRIVWPELLVEVERRIEMVRSEKSLDVVMIEAAVLLQAG